MPTLDFKGKQHIYAHHLTVPYRPIVPDESRSCNPSGADDNLILHGDNLHALKALLPRYANRIKCIYIDPPYNTGKEGWCYNDNVNSPLMQEWLTKTVDIEDLERHDKWLCMMWPRLHILRELLAEDGVIFVSIDDNELHHLRMLMDEIFGEKNFFAVLTRRAMHTVRNSSKDFNLNADYTLAYAKEKSWFGEHKSRYIRHIVDKSTSYPYDDNDGRGKYKFDPLSARNYYKPYTFTFENGVEWQAPSGRYPSYSKDTLRWMERDGRIDFSGSEPRAKRYLAEVQEGQPPDAVLSPEFVGFNAEGTKELRKIFGRGGVFAQPKPVRFVKFLLELLRSKDAIVLDSFAGSGTTAHAVLALNKEDNGNRKFILIECEDYADCVTAERVRRVIKGVPDVSDASLREGLGGSFTYGTLGKPFEIEGMLTGEALPSYESLAAHLLCIASGVSVGANALEQKNDDGLFHSGDGIDYYLLYKPDLEYLRSDEAILNLGRAQRIRDVNHQNGVKAIVYAPGKYIGQRELTGMGITFCQLPHALHER
ncbi:site-specific DNA-methyltransferase [Candidatus Poribacteria bacterium]|nr:site-specific DNA-methyltransferase [Candidatus Poribacteria bacterium]